MQMLLNLYPSLFDKGVSLFNNQIITNYYSTFYFLFQT